MTYTASAAKSALPCNLPMDVHRVGATPSTQGTEIGGGVEHREPLDPDATLSFRGGDNHVVKVCRSVSVDRDVRAEFLRAHECSGVRANLRYRLAVQSKVSGRAGIVA